jgi:hypothetical protein
MTARFQLIMSANLPARARAEDFAVSAQTGLRTFELPLEAVGLEVDARGTETAPGRAGPEQRNKERAAAQSEGVRIGRLVEQAR